MDFSKAKAILGDKFSRDADFLSSVVSKLKLVYPQVFIEI